MKYVPIMYTAIECWGKRLGSFGFYIHGQQRTAAEEDAPLTAIYKRYDGHWVTIADIKSEETRSEMIEASAARMYEIAVSPEFHKMIDDMNAFNNVFVINQEAA